MIHNTFLRSLRFLLGNLLLQCSLTEMQAHRTTLLPSGLVYHCCTPGGGRPKATVLLFAWMLAGDVHLAKYQRLWLSRGFNVLTIKTAPAHALLPAIFARRQVEHILHFLLQYKPSAILFHSLSVGNYICEELLWQLHSNQGENPMLSQILASICGIVRDSITFLEDSSLGTARSITTQPLLQMLIRWLVNLYYTLTRRFTWETIQRVVPHFTENPEKLPTLVLYSVDDPISNAARIRRHIELWKENGVAVQEHCWNRSGHVQHFKFHPDEYEAEVDGFLKRLGML